MLTAAARHDGVLAVLQVVAPQGDLWAMQAAGSAARSAGRSMRPADQKGSRPAGPHHSPGPSAAPSEQAAAGRTARTAWRCVHGTARHPPAPPRRRWAPPPAGARRRRGGRVRSGRWPARAPRAPRAQAPACRPAGSVVSGGGRGQGQQRVGWVDAAGQASEGGEGTSARLSSS